MNSVVLIGRLVREPETRYTAQQMAVTTFTMAIDRMSKDKGADFPKVTVFGKRAENCEKFLSKGKLVGVQGRLQTGSYDKDGQKIYTTDVIADRVEFLSSKNDNSAADKQQADPRDDFQAINEDCPF